MAENISPIFTTPSVPKIGAADSGLVVAAWRESANVSGTQVTGVRAAQRPAGGSWTVGRGARSHPARSTWTSRSAPADVR